MRSFVRSLLASSLLALVGCDPAGPPGNCGGRPRSQCVDSLEVGDSFACALLSDRTVWCWGRDDDGQLGYSASDLCPVSVGAGQTRSVACHNFPQQVTGLAADRRTVRVGGAHVCAGAGAQGYQCWGANETGQLGTGTQFSSPTPAMVPASTEAATSMAPGRHHTCRSAAGKVHCWGANHRGQLGVRDVSERCTLGAEMISCARSPVEVPGLDSVKLVVSGDAHTCALTDDGAVLCWGDDSFGQLGDGEPGGDPAVTPVRVQTERGALYGVVELSAGASHTCALREDRSVLCWGRNDQGQLGVAVAMNVPMGCAAACSARAVIADDFEGTGLLPQGDASFRIDGDTPDVIDPEPDAGVAMEAAVMMDASALREGGAVMDSGHADARAEDTAVMRARPTPIGLSVGGESACVVMDNGTVRCWGSDALGQLGDGRPGGFSPAATQVIASPGATTNNPLQSVASVSVGGSSACAVLSDHTVRCWGSNEAGALGTGNLSPAAGPVPLSW